jgi:hypothetical protein
MPAIVPGVVPAPAAQTPNVASGPAATAAEGDATAAAFASVLTIMLGGHVTEAASATQPTDVTEPNETGDATQPVAAEQSDLTAELGAQEPPAGLTGDALTWFYHPELAASLAIGAPQPTIVCDEKPVSATSGIHRGLGLVNAEFRDRLERVIDRMESEFGYKVEVTETYRTQERQDVLYAQGRTEPGQVVTWTRASNHTLGRAADLVIDGSYDDPVAYERLMRIAREEGLRTLGRRDPGHVELAAVSSRALADDSAEAPPNSARDVRAAVIARPAPSVASLTGIVAEPPELESVAAEHNDASSVAGRPTVDAQGVARVSTVARVATVAQVAQVAQVAIVGAQAAPVVHAASRPVKAADALTSSGPRRGADRASPLATAVQAPSLRDMVTGHATASTSDAEADSGDGRPNEHRGRPTSTEPASARETAADILRQTRDELMRAVTTQDPNAAVSSSPTTREASAVGHADMSERISRLLKVQDAANERPMSQMMLRLERPDGGEDRLRVDLRGNAVSATLDVTDATAADRLGANVKELQRALERHGFETDSLTVRTMTRSTDNSTLARVAGASAETDLQRAAAASSGNSTNTSSRDRGTRSDEQRPSPDQQRQRARKEPKGDR